MSKDQIIFYAWPTPNAFKVSILMEELGLNYKIVPVNIMEGDQFKDEYLKLNPNNKMPTITDQNGPNGKPITVFESGAILMYLAEKSGQFLPQDPHKRYETTQWLFWQMAGFGPMLGQAHHFIKYAKEDVPYAKNRYAKEAARLFDVLDKQLSKNDYIAGDEYTIADMAIYPWSLNTEHKGVEINDYPNIQRWQKVLESREAVKKGMNIMQEYRGSDPSKMSAEQHKKLFGT